MLKHIVLIVVALVFMACVKPLQEDLPLKSNKNLKFFGYTLVDVGWDDPSDKSSKTNYIDEVKEFSNLADILVVDPLENIETRIDFMNSNGVRAVLHLNDLFFKNTGEGGNKSGYIYRLRNDYQARWNSFATINNLQNYDEKIGAFYIGEEPHWNSISEGDFELACNYVKQSIPKVPILMVEAFSVVKEMYVPTSVDWVGFDHYFLDKPSENDKFLDEFNTMKSKLNNHQRILLVMDAHWIKIAHGSSGISKGDLDVIARDYYNFANSDTTIVGILAYYWPNGFEFKKALGVRGLPSNVLKEHQQIGKTITGK